MLTTNQQQRNPTARERQVLAALASGASRQEAAALTGLTPRAVAAILERLRDRFAPTLPALIAIAVKLEWIPVPIWTMPTDPSPLPPPTAPPGRQFQPQTPPPKTSSQVAVD